MSARRVGRTLTVACITIGILFTTSIAADAGRHRVVVQQRAKSLTPRPSAAYVDVSQLQVDGCNLDTYESSPRLCVYGARRSRTSVMLIGDSTAEHYFPAFRRVARQRHWRLVATTKSGCTIAEIPKWLAYPNFREWTECYAWRDKVFAAVREERPDLVVVAGRSRGPVYVDGQPQARNRSSRMIQDGWTTTFRRLRDTGAKVVLMKSAADPRLDVPKCVKAHPRRLARCATQRDRAAGYRHNDARAAARMPAVHVIDVVPIVCNETWCPAVIDDVIVYRQSFHFTASWAKTMAPYIRHRLPRP